MRSKTARLNDWLSGHDASSGGFDAAEEPFDSFGPIRDLQRASNAQRAPTPQSPHEIPRILMAEADAYHRRVLRVLLASPSLSVIEVEDGQSAVDLLSLRSFDVILLGMSLPIMTGSDVLRWVRRSQTPWADIPIVGLIDDAHRDQVGRLMSMGLTDWTPKPVSRSDLASKLLNFLPGLAGSGL
jgi:CheY-like chemotaxis protein